MGQLDRIGGSLTIFDRSGLPDDEIAADEGSRPALNAPELPALFERHLPSEAATAAVIAHPGFAQASRAAAAGLPSEEDRRLRRLAPAQPLFDWHRQRCVHFLTAAATIIPDAADAPGGARCA